MNARIARTGAAVLGTLGRTGIRLIDALISRRLGVFAYCRDEDCLLKVAPSRTETEVVLAHGRRLPPGAPVLELHLWNERLSVLEGERGGLALGTALARRVRHSLQALAAYLESTDPQRRIAALHGEMGFIPASEVREAEALLCHLGFEFRPGEVAGPRFWRPAFWRTLFSWWLMWTFGPRSLHGRRLREMARAEVWMDRETLHRLYGS